MSRRPRLVPKNPVLLHAQVVQSRQLSPSFQRVTIAGADLKDFEYLGFDQWFRLFIPQRPGATCDLPGVGGNKWWKSYLALDEAERPHCANYTVAEVRKTDASCELDIDVVLHWDAEGALAGPVAIWSATVEAGTPVAILDQGLIYDPGLQQAHAVIACDETGLPAARGILRNLPAPTNGVAILEVPNATDAIDLEKPAGVEVKWIPRGDAHAQAGQVALSELERLDMPTDTTYAYIVGESSLATGGRRVLHRKGIPKPHITFSGYWKAD